MRVPRSVGSRSVFQLFLENLMSGILFGHSDNWMKITSSMRFIMRLTFRASNFNIRFSIKRNCLCTSSFSYFPLSIKLSNIMRTRFTNCCLIILALNYYFPENILKYKEWSLKYNYTYRLSGTEVASFKLSRSVHLEVTHLLALCHQRQNLSGEASNSKTCLPLIILSLVVPLDL